MEVVANFHAPEGKGGLYKVPFDGTPPSRIISVPSAAESSFNNFATIASDGSQFFIVNGGILEAYPLVGGFPGWSLPLIQAVNQGHDVYCATPAIRDDALFAACYDAGQLQGGDLTGEFLYGGAPSDSSLVVVAVDLAKHKVRWSTTYDLSATLGTALLSDTCSAIATAASCKSAFFPQHMGITVVGASVLLNANAIEAGAGYWGAFLAAFEAETGDLRWHHRDPGEPNPDADEDLAPLLIPGTSFFTPGTPRGIYWKAGNQLFEVNPQQGWNKLPTAGGPASLTMGNKDSSAATSCGTVIHDGGIVYASSPETIIRTDPMTWTVETQVVDRSIGVPNDALESWWACLGMQVHGDVLYARIASYETANVGRSPVSTFWALDKESLDPLWNITFHQPGIKVENDCGCPHMAMSFAVADDKLIIDGIDGTVRILGTTPASPVVQPLFTSLYPEAGAIFTVNLAESIAGKQGALDRFAVDWGDGTSADWGPTATFSHAYSQAGDYMVRFMVGGGPQTASVTQVLHVGTPDPAILQAELEAARTAANRTPEPPELNLLQQAFAPEFQDWTLFFIGLVITAVGASVGLLRLTRRRTRVRRELDAVATILRRFGNNPIECERRIAAKRLHVAELHLDGKLDEAQLAVVEKRMDEVIRTVRTSTFEAKLDYLPYGLVKMVRRILEDSHVASEEVRAFHAALAASPGLTVAQKAEARSLVDGWSARDSGKA